MFEMRSFDQKCDFVHGDSYINVFVDFYKNSIFCDFSCFLKTTKLHFWGKFAREYDSNPRIQQDDDINQTDMKTNML